MPIYEYKCEDCKEKFSLLQRVGTTEKDTICPQCGSSRVKRIFSTFSCSSSTSGGFTPSFSGPT